MVKVNKNHIKKSDALSPWIIWFLFRMQLAQCVKQYLIHWATKKEKLGADKIPDMIIHWFYRVSFPTLVLYVWVVLFKNYACPHLDKLKAIPALNMIDCDWCVFFFEMIYIAYFIYVEFRAKAQKNNEKKLLKEKKHRLKNKEYNDNIESSNELYARATDKRDVGPQIDS